MTYKTFSASAEKHSIYVISTLIFNFGPKYESWGGSRPAGPGQNPWVRSLDQAWILSHV